jgi:hypothetical protein
MTAAVIPSERSESRDLHLESGQDASSGSTFEIRDGFMVRLADES